MVFPLGIIYDATIIEQQISVYKFTKTFCNQLFDYISGKKCTLIGMMSASKYSLLDVSAISISNLMYVPIINLTNVFANISQRSEHSFWLVIHVEFYVVRYKCRV